MPEPNSPERRSKIRQLFEELSELPSSEHAAFLDRVCKDDPDLRRELTSLLKHADSDEVNFEDFARKVVNPLLDELKEDPEGLKNILEEASAPGSELEDSMVGRRISHFDIIEPIGRGGMGVVYKAQDQKLHRTVAIKFLPRNLTTDTEANSRFITEARAASSLDHPNIATIYEIGETPKQRLFIAMAYYKGETLNHTIRRGQIPMKQAINIWIQIVDALAKAHEKGVVHRDVKPGNIMVCEDGAVKLLDFGLAKLVHLASLTQTGMTSGTAAYMSPEQARGGVIDHRTDIWSLGAVMYEMLTGEKPFQGDNAYATIYSILHDKPKPITELRPDEDPALINIIEHCLERDPNERPVSARQLLEELEQLAEKAGLAFHQSRSRTAAPYAEPLTQSQLRDEKEASTKASRSGISGFWNKLSGLNKAFIATIPVIIFSILAVFLYMQTYTAAPFSDRSNEKGDLPDFISNSTSLLRLSEFTIPAVPEKSIAVLPFDNLSNNEEDQFFTDGIHLELLTQISKIKDIKSIAPQTVKSYKDTTKNTKTIGEELGVATLLSAGVQRGGNQIQINVYLVDAATEMNLWSESYIGELDSAEDIFTIRNQIASAVAEQLQAVLTREERDSTVKIPTQNLNALEAYFKGKEILASDIRQRMLEATEHFEKAIELDPAFVQAYVSLAETYWARTIGRIDQKITQVEALEKIDDLLAKAMELDDGLAEVHTLLGRIKRYGKDYAGAEKSYLRALELNPNYAQAWNEYAKLQKDEETGIAMLKKAIALDPANLEFRPDLILDLCWLGRFKEALAQAEQLVRSNPDYSEGNWLMGAILMDAYGRYDEGLVRLRKAVAQDPRNLWNNTYLMMCYEVLGDRSEAARWAERQLNLRKESTNLFQLAELYRLRDEDDLALENFRKFLQPGERDYLGRDYRAWRYVLNADLRAGRYQEARDRYAAAFPELFEEDPLIEYASDNKIERFAQVRMAMQLAAVLSATGEKAKANRLLDRGWELFRRRPRMGMDGNIGYGIRDVIMYALKGEKRQALDAMRQAVDAGYRDRFFLDAAELDPLRDDPEFIPLMQEIEEDLARQLANVRRMDANGELAPIPKLPESASLSSISRRSDPSSPLVPRPETLAPSAKSIAVLPLENMSPDSDNAFFADGVHEDILTNMAKIGELMVIARRSTLRYRNTQKRLSEIADELSVDHLVTGSVRRAGNQVRVSVQLIDLKNENQVLWSEHYTEPLDDIFDIQSSIAKEIARQLKATILPEEMARIDYRPTQNQEAYDYFVQTREPDTNNLRKISLLEKAVELDPQFSKAWAYLASDYIRIWNNRENRNNPALLAKAHTALEQAKRTGPDLPELPWAQSYFSWHEDLNEEATIRYLLQALAIDPGFQPSLLYVGWKYLQLGQLPEAQFHFENAKRIDPLSIISSNYLPRAYKRSGNWTKAKQLIEENLRRDPNRFGNHWHLARLHFQQTGDAKAQIEELAAIPGYREEADFRFLEAVQARQYAKALEALESDDELRFTGPIPLFGWVQSGQSFHGQALAALLSFELGEKAKWKSEIRSLKTELERIVKEDPNKNPDHWAFLAVCHALEGDHAQMKKMIARTREVASKEYFRYRFQQGCEMIISLAYMALGENEKAIEILEDASQLDGWPFLNRELEFWFMFDRLRGNPRFDALLKD